MRDPANALLQPIGESIEGTCVIAFRSSKPNYCWNLFTSHGHFKGLVKGGGSEGSVS